MKVREISFKAYIDGSLEKNLKIFGLSSIICNRLKKELGLVLLCNIPRPLPYLAKQNDEIRFFIYEESVREIPVFDYPVNIVYEDEDLAIINKNGDIAVMSTKSHYGRSLENALANVWEDMIYRPVNRLDRDTSGLMIVAKNSPSHCILSTQAYHIDREYLALVNGEILQSGVIETNIDRVSEESMKRQVSESGKYAYTSYRVEENYNGYTLLRLKLHTGRTHQIRVHCAYIGYPLVGDTLYGGNNEDIARHALHSERIEFTHPINKQKMMFVAELPSDMQNLCKIYKKRL